MAFIINEQRFIEDNVSKVKERMTSQLNRFTDKKTTFTKYFHINNMESIVDSGFENVARILGVNSPIRFNSIANFPILGIENIMLDISDEDEGLTTNFDSEGILLPGTIEPTPNDFFLINYLGKDYLFQVTEMSFDTIKSHNFYKINFTLRSIETDVASLYAQVTEEYECIYTNIGTNENCIIKKKDYDLIQRFEELYKEVAENYSKYFYNTKYNSFIFTKNVLCKIYDPYINFFITSNNIFNHKYDIETKYTMIEDCSRDFDKVYDKTFYKCLEKKRKDRLIPLEYYYAFVQDNNSIFKYYRDNTVVTLKFINKPDSVPYIPVELMDILLHAEDKVDTEIDAICQNPVYRTIFSYFNSPSNLDIYSLKAYGLLDCDLEWIDENDFDMFILIPVVLYIIRITCKKYLEIEKTI